MHMRRFAGRNVYITGGSAGIGLASARRFAGLGANILILARGREPLEQAAASIEAMKAGKAQRVQFRQLDVTDCQQTSEVLAEAVASFGVPDVLINNAGRARPRYFEDITHAQLDETFRLNVYSCWNTIQALLPHMKPRGGYIVNVSSMAGLIGTFGYSDYCASKFAVAGFSEALRSEVKRHGIMVSVLCPPDTDTPGFEEENRTKPPETRAVSAQAARLSAEKVAEALIAGMRKGRPVIIPGIEGRLAYLVKRWCPGIVEWTMDRAIRRAQEVNSGAGHA